jgi:hypothetical protein
MLCRVHHGAAVALLCSLQSTAAGADVAWLLICRLMCVAARGCIALQRTRLDGAWAVVLVTLGRGGCVVGELLSTCMHGCCRLDQTWNLLRAVCAVLVAAMRQSLV